MAGPAAIGLVAALGPTDLARTGTTSPPALPDGRQNHVVGAGDITAAVERANESLGDNIRPDSFSSGTSVDGPKSGAYDVLCDASTADTDDTITSPHRVRARR
ncbi:hypothetical protein AB0L47_10795 [Streptomyces bobili]|uniref:hypothetical protein n=1 Tax=Streptomyces bobili TaxID=67280 RepID=UPI00343D9268